MRNVLGPAGAALMLLGISTARGTTIADLGYPQGVTLTGPCPSQIFYFPLAAPASGGALNVHMDASAALSTRSTLTVTAGGVPIATLPATTDTTTIPIPSRFTQGDYVQLVFTADQSINGSTSCDDSGSDPAVWMQLEPDTALAAVTSGQGGISGIWRGLTAPVGIALPSHPSLTDIETALILSTALVERGIAPFFTTSPTSAAIAINSTTRALAAAASPPLLTVPSPDAARALIAAPDLFQDVRTSALEALFTARPADADTTLGALGVPPLTVLTGHDTKLNFPLPFSHLPAGAHASALTLYGVGAALPPGETEIITFEIGGDVIWSQAFQTIPALNGVRIDLPDRLIASGALADLRFIRLKANGGTNFVALPFTVSDASRLDLAATNPSPRRFAAFTVASGAPVQVLSDQPPAALVATLPLLSELLGAAGANPIAIKVARPTAAPTTPFILVSANPAGIVSIAPIPNPTAQVQLKLPDAAAALTISSGGASSVLQLVSAGHPGALTPGLWLSPGPAATLARATLPGDGNVAFYTGAATPATFSTQLHDAEFQPAPTGTLNLLLANWNTVLFGAFWLLLTVSVVNIFVSRRRRAHEP